MNTIKLSKSLLAVSIAAMMGLSACGGGGGSSEAPQTQTPKTETPKTGTPKSETPKTEKGAKFAVGFKASTTNEPEYLVGVDDLTKGTINADGKGVEQIGWNFVYNVDNTVFVTGYEDFEARAYEKVNGKITKKASFFYDNPIEVFGNVNDKIMLASDTPRDGSHTARKLYVIDEDSGQITQKLNYTIFDNDTGTAGEGSTGWPFALMVRGDKMFVPFQKIKDDGSYGTPAADGAHVAVYKYPFVKNDKGVVVPEKVISDDRTSNIGVNGVSTGLIKTDSGDLYSFSNGKRSAGFSPAATKPSGILKIKAGTTKFDTGYFFDIEQATKGGSIFWFDHVGGDKAIARIITDEKGCLAAEAEAGKEGACAWAGYTKKYMNQKLVIIDLAAKTITDVEGVPLHAKRYTSPINVINGKAYVSIETKDDAHIYEIDVATAKGTKGANIDGKTIKGVYPLD